MDRLLRLTPLDHEFAVRREPLPSGADYLPAALVVKIRPFAPANFGAHELPIALYSCAVHALTNNQLSNKLSVSMRSCPSGHFLGNTLFPAFHAAWRFFGAASQVGPCI